MNDKDFKEEKQNQEQVEEQVHYSTSEQEDSENLLSEALAELNKQKKKEKYLLTAVFAFMMAGMGFGYTIWQNNKVNTTIDYYGYNGGTPTAYAITDPASSGGGCGGDGGGGCGSGAASAGASVGVSAGAGGCCGGSTDGAPVDTKEIETLARQFYKQNFGDDTNLKFNVADYGCHVQIDVYDGDKIIRSLVYRGGQISEY